MYPHPIQSPERGCPGCKHTPPPEDNKWWEFDSMSMVAGPAIEMVAKCKLCNARFIISHEPMKDPEVPNGNSNA